MKRAAVIALTVALLLVALPRVCLAQRRYTKWENAARVARRSGKIVCCILKPDQRNRSYAAEETTVRLLSWPIFTTLGAKEVRGLQSKYFVVMVQNASHPDSNAQAFRSHLAGPGCLFAAPDGQVLTTIPTNADVKTFTGRLKTAVEKARQAEAERRKALEEEQQKRADLARLLRDAEKHVKCWQYLQALEKLDKIINSAEDPEWPEVGQAKQAKAQLLKRADHLVGSADRKAKQGKVLPALRDLDEVAHLFAGLPAADRAAARLEAILADPAHADTADAYRAERQVYTLYDRGCEFEARKKWKEAVQAYQKIVKEYRQSPVAERAGLRLATCRPKVRRPRGDRQQQDPTPGE